MRLAHNQSGLSLVEVVIALAVTGIITGVILNFTLGNLAAFARAEAKTNLLDQARLGLDVINSDIRLSATADSLNRVEDPYSPNSPTSNFSWQSDDDTLVLATAAEDVDGNILFSDATMYISYKNNSIYYLSDGALYKRVLAAPITGNKAVTTCPPASVTPECPADRKILDNIESFSITYRDGNNQTVIPENARSIELAVTLQQQRYGQDVSVSHTTRTVFRND